MIYPFPRVSTFDSRPEVIRSETSAALLDACYGLDRPDHVASDVEPVIGTRSD